MVEEIYRCNVCGRTKIVNYELIEVHPQDGYACPNVDDDFNFCKGTLLGTRIYRGSEQKSIIGNKVKTN